MIQIIPSLLTKYVFLLCIISIMLTLQQLKTAGGLSAIESALNERLKNSTPSKIVFSTIGASLIFAYVYSQLTHKVIPYSLHYIYIHTLGYALNHWVNVSTTYFLTECFKKYQLDRVIALCL